MMNHSQRIAGSGLNSTAFTSDQMGRSKNVGYGMSGVSQPIPERMTSSIESKRKG